MNYKLNKDTSSIAERICKINGIDESILDISDLKIDYDLVAVDKDGNEVIFPATIEDVDVKKIQFVDLDNIGKDKKKVSINVSELLK